jgi:hypothetical protein
MPLALFIVVLDIRCRFLCRPVWAAKLLFYVSHCSWDDLLPCPAFSVQMGASQTFLLGLAQNPDSPDLNLLHSWDDRHIPPVPILVEMGSCEHPPAPALFWPPITIFQISAFQVPRITGLSHRLPV